MGYLSPVRNGRVYVCTFFLSPFPRAFYACVSRLFFALCPSPPRCFCGTHISYTHLPLRRGGFLPLELIRAALQLCILPPQPDLTFLMNVYVQMSAVYIPTSTFLCRQSQAKTSVCRRAAGPGGGGALYVPPPAGGQANIRGRSGRVG